MLSAANETDTDLHVRPQYREAVNRLCQVVLDGLRHGYFRYAISGSMGKGNRRELVIEAGKSYKFTIPEEELPR
jgi:hypothetical protein